MCTIQEVQSAVERERNFQDNKWGTVQEYPHSLAEWIEIMLEELREARRAWFKLSREDALREVLQVVTTGIACLEQNNSLSDAYKPCHSAEKNFTVLEWIVFIKGTLNYATYIWASGYRDEEILAQIIEATNCGIMCLLMYGLYER